MTQSKGDKVEILIVAAEASSALYAQRLLEYWQKSALPVRAFGIGSEGMVALGFEALGRSEDLAVVGLTEVIKHYGEIKNVFYNIVSEVERRKPRVILLLDYPDFNLRLAKKLKRFNIPIVYYISPQIWAWRKSRIHDIKALVDKMLVLLPFEESFYASNGVNVEFVGHPILDELHPKFFNEEYRNLQRNRYGVLSNETWVGLMPGSRTSELKHHLALQIQVAEKMYSQNQKLKFALLLAPTVSKKKLQLMLPKYSIPLILMQEDPMQMVSSVDVVLCASGTATLVAGLLLKPMVIMYRMNPLSALIAKIVVKGTSHFGLINLVLGRRVITELFQAEANVDNLVGELNRLINNKEHRNAVVADLTAAAKLLGTRGATKRVAEILSPMLFGDVS